MIGGGNMRRPAALLLVLVGLLLAACGGPPESRLALSEPGETAYDERLAGVWYWTDRGETYYLHISPREETALLDVVGIMVRPGDHADPVRWLRATAHASNIDGETFYNVQRVPYAGGDYSAPEESPGFIILRAEITEEDALLMGFMKGYILEDLIEEGRLSGREVEGRYRDEEVPYLMLDSSRRELVALIREVPPGELFNDDPEPFRRLRPLSPDEEEAEESERR